MNLNSHYFIYSLGIKGFLKNNYHLMHLIGLLIKYSSSSRDRKILLFKQNYKLIEHSYIEVSLYLCCAK